MKKEETRERKFSGKPHKNRENQRNKERNGTKKRNKKKHIGSKTVFL